MTTDPEQERNSEQFGELRGQLTACQKDLLNEKHKNTSLFFIIGGIISYELGQTLQVFHELLAMLGSVLAVLLSLYGIFRYFEIFTKSSQEHQ